MTRFRKIFAITICLTVLQGFCGGALGQINQAHRQQLLQTVPPNYSIARSAKAARQGYVPTNTVAFQDYALSLILTQANFLNERWQLGMPKAVTSDHVTGLSAIAKLDGPEGAILVSNRFVVGFLNGRWHSFNDKHFCWENLEMDIPRLEQLSQQPSLLTKADARTIAREALRAVGIDERRLKVSLPPEVSLYEYESRDGKVSFLPLFKVQWMAGKESGPIRMEVSGITKKVVAYANYSAPPMPIPTNYFAMLGVSSRPSDWGAQFGYDSANTPEFQSAARQLAIAQVNRLNEIWSLGSKKLSTNDLTVFQAKPTTNGFDILARFDDRFQLQVAQSQIQWFKDMAHNIEALTEDDQTLSAALAATNSLNPTSAVQLARQALHQMGWSEKQLQLREPPSVTQVTVPADDETPQKLPLYDVFWHFAPEEFSKYGENAAAVAFQVSGLTRKVVMYANNWPLTPKLTLPTNALAPNALPQRRR